MSYPVPTANIANGAIFQNFFDNLNMMANLMSTSVVTANASANGALTTGNAYVNGIFGALTGAFGSIGGGNVQTPNTLIISTNVAIGNLSFTPNTLSIGSLTANSSAMAVGNVVMSGSGVTVNGVSVALSNTPTLTVLNNGNAVSTRSKINFIPGTAMSIVVTDDGLDGQINVTFAVVGSNTVSITSVANIGGPTVSTSALQIALGLGNAAYLSVGTGANTVASGNDARITGAAQSNGANFTGPVGFNNTVTVPTPTANDSSNNAASTAFVVNAIATASNNINAAVNTNAQAITNLKNQIAYALCISM